MSSRASSSTSFRDALGGMKSVLERIASKNLTVFKLLNEFFERQDKVFYLPDAEGFSPRNISSDEARSTINVIRIGGFVAD